MKGKILPIVVLILTIVGAALLIIAHYNPEIPWIMDCVALCSVSIAVCLFIQIQKSKRAGKDVDTKKVVICIVVGAVLTIAVIWIVLIKVLKVGLE